MAKDDAEKTLVEEVLSMGTRQRCRHESLAREHVGRHSWTRFRQNTDER